MVIELHLSCMKSERWNSVEDDLSKICLAIVELTLNLEYYFMTSRYFVNKIQKIEPRS